MAAVAQELKRHLCPILVTREPGGTRVAEKIRALLLKNSMNPWTELFLYEASRVEHLSQTILPALKKRKIVLCDRFADSSLAYQSYARGLAWKEVTTLNQIATQGLRPDLTVFLDSDPAYGLKRAQVRTRFEREGVRFLTQVRRGFLKARREDPSRWLTLKAFSKKPEELAKQVVQAILSKSENQRKNYG